MTFPISIRRRLPVIISLLLLLQIAGCGPSRVDECRQIIGVINKSATETEANLKKGDVARLEEVANNLSALQIKDEKLKGFQTQLVESYRNRQRILKEKIAGSGNRAVLQQTDAELTVELGKEQLLQQEFSAYCKG
jgi:hypothetical protein